MYYFINIDYIFLEIVQLLFFVVLVFSSFNFSSTYCSKPLQYFVLLQSVWQPPLSDQQRIPQYRCEFCDSLVGRIHVFYLHFYVGVFLNMDLQVLYK